MHDEDVDQQERIEREKKTIRIMIGIYCHDYHDGGEVLCTDCEALWEYALQRIDKCPQRPNKPTCANCIIHCYKPDMRDQIKSVMRHSGPQMRLNHPMLTLLHHIEGSAPEPPPPETKCDVT